MRTIPLTLLFLGACMPHADRRLVGRTVEITAIAFAPDGRLLITGDREGILELWDPEGRIERPTLFGHGKEITAIAVHPSSRQLASAGRDGTVRLWDLTGREDPSFLGDVQGVPLTLAFAPDGDRLAVGYDDGHVELREVSDSARVWRISAHAKGVRALAFDRSGHLASGGDEGTARLWNASDGSEVRKLMEMPTPCVALAFSPNGKILAIGEEGSACHLVRLDGKRSPVRFDPSGSLTARVRKTAVAFSPDGRRVVWVSGGAGVDRIDVDSEQREDPLRAGLHGPFLSCVAVRPDGRTIAAGTTDGSVEIWDD